MTEANKDWTNVCHHPPASKQDMVFVISLITRFYTIDLGALIITLSGQPPVTVIPLSTQVLAASWRAFISETTFTSPSLHPAGSSHSVLLTIFIFRERENSLHGGGGELGLVLFQENRTFFFSK